MTLADQICRWIQQTVKEANSSGVVVGLSGGIDSSVVGVLARRAMGDHVLGLIMPCRSQPTDEEYAKLVASRFGIPTVRVDLAPLLDSFLELVPPGNEMAQANLKPRLRMLTLYYFANSRGYLVAGTGNKSELMVGYFTKYGDGGVDILPLGGLLKTQVRQLARDLGIPQEIIARPPSAGLWAGQTDEGELGITYEDLDKAIEAIERGGASGCDPAVIAVVQGMYERSRHKRSLPLIFQPSF